MDWDKLKSFYEIAISKSISKASAKLNISQSALSRQIQDLESVSYTHLTLPTILRV